MVDLNKIVLIFTVAIVGLPALSFLLLLLLRRFMPKKGSVLATTLVGISLLLSFFILFAVLSTGNFAYRFAWYVWGNLNVSFGLNIDELTALMLVVVSAISFLVHLYSIGYMHGDKRFGWYFAVLSLFSSAMLGLVVADNYLQMYIFWELVGLCSYLLIGFWFEKKSASDAAKKAFIVTRLGDVGFGLGVILLFTSTGSFAFSEIFRAAEGLAPHMITASALLIFCGAVGKSAQFPLHVWLPDAMEGPTPVSALIHAATMVAAGVYLVARSFPLFELSKVSMSVVLWIGAFTALLAATMAVVMTDIKKVLAYSTISQLGYMMAALGAGGYFAGVFHLMTNAFFKALLFLGSGSVIHAIGTQEITEMGGLGKKMKTTAITFVLGSLSIAGFPLFSGFWSKDEVLVDVFNNNLFAFIILAFTAFLTAFYMFKLVFLTFFGKSSDKTDHAHESPRVMRIPLIVLAIFAVAVGFIGSPLLPEGFRFAVLFSPNSFEAHHTTLNYLVMIISVVLGLGGIALAYGMYGANRIQRDWLSRFIMPYYRLLKNKYYLDEIYMRGIVRPVLWIADVVFAFDQKVIDWIVNMFGKLTIVISKAIGVFDLSGVDGAVNWIGKITMGSGMRARKVQTGYALNYALIFFAVVTVMIIWILVVGGLYAG
ncbi:MAG: NADH-quinone oxidoreductase subunit L [Actinobacteria bacterium]|nr:NADH-quinone oxidoreductase subunit L [Actinomycetota bacterium]